MTEILNSYTPKAFGHEYVDINGSSQYPMFAATALGVKNSFDDWIDVRRYDEFVRVCKDYGLYVEHDVIFGAPDSSKDELVGGKNLTTTFAVGKRFDSSVKEGKVHVFVAKTKKIVGDAKRFGWYPVVTGKRCINKPFVDHLRFGRLLGFPDCCVDFFRMYNNWAVYSHPLETLKNTPRIKGKAIGSYYCNNFLMDNTFFYIHNLPCSYRCEKTIKFAKEVERKLKEVEPDFVKRAIKLLKMPLMAFSERNFVIFDGIMKNRVISYTNCQYNPNPGRPEENIGFFKEIKKGDKFSIEDDELVVSKGSKEIFRTNKKESWFMIDFD